MTKQAIRRKPLDAWINVKIDSPSAILTRQAMAGYQLKKLQETIDLAYERSPFYREHLGGLAGQRLTCLEDVRRIPFTTAEQIQDNALQMLCVSQDEINRVVTLDSSGTTGKPKRLYFTRADQELTIDWFKQGMSVLAGPGDRVLILMPGERPGSVGDLLASALERLGAIPIKYGLVASLPETARIVAETRANILVGIPIQILALVRYYETNNRAAPIALKRILLSTDYAPQAVIKEIERVWQCEVFDHYGMTEMGLGGGIECCAHSGHHLREADLYFEIIDPQTGELLPEGRCGEVVFTTLTRRGMPLIRYRTGDLSRLIPGECSCGTVLRRLDYIKARKTGLVLLGDRCCLTIADLDEKLLVLPGVVDFTASVTRQQMSTQLKIEIMVLKGKVSLQDVQDALSQISVLRFAQKWGMLELLIEPLTCDDDFVPRVGKRTIGVVQSCERQPLSISNVYLTSSFSGIGRE